MIYNIVTYPLVFPSAKNAAKRPQATALLQRLRAAGQHLNALVEDQPIFFELGLKGVDISEKMEIHSEIHGFKMILRYSKIFIRWLKNMS